MNLSNEVFNAKPPPPPEGPPPRIICDACGTLPASGEHKDWLCRFVIWINKLVDKSQNNT